MTALTDWLRRWRAFCGCCGRPYWFRPRQPDPFWCSACRAHVLPARMWFHLRPHLLFPVWGRLPEARMSEIPGCDDNGVPSPEVTDWILNVYAHSIDILTALFMERGAGREQADHLARTCLARLAHAKPPITVELLGD